MEPTLDQKRAAAAWEAIHGKTAADGKTAAGGVPAGKAGEQYTAWVRKVPSMVLSSGLGQTLAFLRAKAKDDHSKHQMRVYDHLSEWVLPQLRANTPPGERRQLLEWLLQQDSETYRQATAEAMAYCGWLKRFAEAQFGDVTEVEE